MRSLILGISILMAVPAYVVGQQRDRSTTGRTAVPRDEAVQAAPARQADRRAGPRGGTGSPSPREERSDDDAPSRAGRDTPSAAQTSRRRLHDERPPAVPARTLPWCPEVQRQPPCPIAVFNPFPNRGHWRPGQRDGEYRSRYRRSYRGSNVAFIPYASPVVVEREVIREVPSVPVIVERPSPARLVLDIYPPTAHVFADGYYIGIPEDFRFEDGGAVLDPGPHRIDIIARDYEPVSFDVNLTRGQWSTFRQILTPILPAPQPPPVVAPPAKKQPVTFYLIPGCYMGNVPPKEANLPATCDITRALSFQY